MSASVVDTDHIDFLVFAAVRFNMGHASVRWGTYPNQEEIRDRNATEVGSKLLAENIASVMHRYPDCTIDDLPGPIPTPSAIDYTYRPFPIWPEPVAVLKAISGYEYQSCEHPGWETSDARAFCDRLRSAAITLLPGYEDADWSVSRRSLATA